MKNIAYSTGRRNTSSIELEIDGVEAGHLEIASEGFGAFRIESVEIDPAFRGKGYYKGLLLAAFQLYGIDTLRSHERNEKSNPIYQSWTGNPDLEGSKIVWIQLAGDSLVFTEDEE